MTEPPRDQMSALLDLYRRGQMAMAAERAEKLARRYPRAVVLWNLMGAASASLGRLDQAERAFIRACELCPDYADAHSNVGNVFLQRQKLDEAVAAFRRALAINADHADAHNNLGNALKAQNKLDEAVAAYRRAIAIEPRHAAAYFNLGIALREQNNLNEAIAAYRRVLAMQPDHVDACLNQSIALLSAGDLRAGFKGYESRWRAKGAQRFRRSAKPLWLGDSDIAGRTILLWGDQGLGDQIQFARYASCLSERGAQVILEVKDALVRVLSDLKGVSKVVPASRPVADTEFDVHCPLMSLPLALGTDLSTIPPVPGITTHLKDVPRWADRLGSDAPRVGIAWSGNPQHKNDHNRSIALPIFAAILSSSCTWINLQKDVSAADRERRDILGRIRNFDGEISDFVDTAALCENCDLVISVDTSVAHLAATLGRPVWLLLPFAADWRWLQGRSDSPWYPSVKLYRQDRIADWGGVLDRVRADLQGWLAAR